MPSFDVVSEVDSHELTNAVDQTNREVGNRFDFKGTDSKVALEGEVLILEAPSSFQIEQMRLILDQKLAKRSIDIACLEAQEIKESGMRATQRINVRQGIDKETGKKIVKLVKESKVKVQAAIQDQQVRVTGKKRDDLQEIIQLLRTADLDLPLQFSNFRD